MKLYLVATAVWIATVTATLESDSRGNWSNEKTVSEHRFEKTTGDLGTEETKKIIGGHYILNGYQNERTQNSSQQSNPEEATIATVKFIPATDNNYGKNETQGDSQQRHSKQLVQPYILPVEEKRPEETSPNESETAARPARTSQNETVIVEYFPSQEIILQESTATTKLPSTHENSFNDLGYSIPEEQIDVESVGDFGQRVRAPTLRQRSNSFGRLKSRQPVTNASSSEEHRKHSRKYPRPFVSKKLNISENPLGTYPEDPVLLTSAIEPQKALKQKDIEEDNLKSDFHKSNQILSLPWTSDEASQSSNREQKLRKHNVEMYNSASTKDSSSSVGTMSLGKFSGPIVVPDLPRQKKYSSSTIDYFGNNEVAKSTPSPESTKAKGPDTGYLAASPVILNPLQVGVALMNAGQDLHSLNDDKEFQHEVQSSQLAAPNSDVVIQNESTDGSTHSQDQLSQQEQISEVSNAPTHSVEIQKSVEIYHTAPVHEIHYPMEYVPNNEQPLMKQDYRKLPKGRRPGQVSIYKSNEITDELVPSSNLDRGRHDYNENDVVYSGSIGQLDQVVRPDKPNFGARDQLDSKIVVTQQPSRLTEVLPNLVNLESAQGTQEVPQILVNKPASDPQTDQQLRLLMAAPQPYQVEKMIEKQITIAQPFPVHVPVDRIVEKQIRIPYPVHVEKVIEKKVPIAIQRVLIPFPIHFRVPQPVPIPVEKIVEKPIPVPVPVEKVVEKPVVHVARPYPVEAAKFVKSVAIPIYNVQNDGNYQQVIRQQTFQTLPSYGSDDQGYYNNSTQLYGLGYALNRPLARQPVVHTLPKKFGSYGSQQYSHSYSVGGNGGNTVSYGRVEKDKILDEYVGPVPRKVPIGIQSKSIQYTSDIQATLRRTRQDGVIGNTGSFRQSKMEYGFKPPMVPSVQYDEQTATKVE
ncbi:uncharacterized protein LOC143218140 [Lasioglossum baleicum]|uniref:uncharacterized protein LOC143218140 n=1 Tax=Lasioglossum baleicum TaxID=434251 RepID=UPI003FCDA6AB